MDPNHGPFVFHSIPLFKGTSSTKGPSLVSTRFQRVKLVLQKQTEISSFYTGVSVYGLFSPISHPAPAAPEGDWSQQQSCREPLSKILIAVWDPGVAKRSPTNSDSQVAGE